MLHHWLALINRFILIHTLPYFWGGFCWGGSWALWKLVQLGKRDILGINHWARKAKSLDLRTPGPGQETAPEGSCVCLPVTWFFVCSSWLRRTCLASATLSICWSFVWFSGSFWHGSQDFPGTPISHCHFVLLPSLFRLIDPGTSCQAQQHVCSNNGYGKPHQATMWEIGGFLKLVLAKIALRQYS